MHLLAGGSTEVREGEREMLWPLPTLQPPSSSHLLDRHSWHPAGMQARGLTQPNTDAEQSLEGWGMDLKVNKARTGPCWLLTQVLLLTYWENLNKSFSFSDLTSFICKIKMWNYEFLMSLWFPASPWVSSPFYLTSASTLWFTFSCMDTKVLDIFLQIHTINSVISFYFIWMYCHLCVVLKIQPNNSGRYAACVCFSTLCGFSLSLEQYQCNRKFLTCIMDGSYEESFFLM